MKLTIKTLQNLTFNVEIEPDKTVMDLKDAIEKEQGKNYPCSSQKLIYNGKILTNESKLSEYEFDEKKFVVLMVTRPPPAPKPSEQTSSTSSTAKQEPEDKSKQTKEAEGKSTTMTTSTTASTTTTAVSTPVTTAQSRNEPARAPQQPSGGSRAAAAALTDMSALSMGEPQIAARLASLMSQPHFRHMQDLIQQQPHLLSHTIESLAASDPEMYSFISENPDIFVSALNHPPLTGLRSSDAASGQQRQGGGSGGGAISQQGGGGLGILGQQPVAEQLLGNVTEHDKAAIERLKELGFSELLAVQAYMACEKDEQLAANLLFQMDQ